MSAESIPARKYFAYGLPALPLALVAITFYVYVPKFYSDVVGVSLTTIGWISLFSRIWDGLIDPGMGAISDRTTWRRGRRLPWMMIGVFPLILSAFFVMNPALCPEVISFALWLGFWTILFFLFWTVVNVPYEALGAELTFNYHERTKLLGFRDGALVLGTIFAVVFPVAYDGLVSSGSESDKYFFLSILYGVLLLGTILWCYKGTSEREWDVSKRPAGSLFKSTRHVLSNKPFRILLFAYTIGAFGAMLPATLILYYVEYVLGGDQTTANLFLLLYFTIGFLLLPLWIWISRKVGKKQAWISAMCINTGAFAGVFFLGPGALFEYGVLVAFSAIGYGATLSLPSSMQADVIDYDEYLHGTRKEGQFIGLWSIAKKWSAALGTGIGLPILGMSGYVPNVAQSEGTLLMLRFLYAGVPCVCNFVAILIALRYPITQGMYEEIRQVIDERSQVLSETDDQEQSSWKGPMVDRGQ